ncbi:MAG: alpha/beta hydrolase [Gemmatimonadaceae bacterium]
MPATLLAVSAVVATIAAILVRRALQAHAVEGRFEARFAGKRNVQRVIAGAEAFTLHGTGDRAIVLLHGYNDSPQTLRSPARAFHDAGWTVYVPLLPGHGRTLQDFADSNAEHWIGAGRGAVREALARHARVAVGGLSMGGAIAIITAAEFTAVQGAVLFAPFLVHSRRLGLIARSWPLLSLWTKYLTGGKASRSIRDPEARQAIIAYGCSTPHLLREIQKVVRRARAALPQVTQPVFMAQSSDDYRIPVADAEAAFNALGSTDKALHWTTGNGHVITMDYGHEQLSADAVAWLDERIPAR